MFKNIFKNIKKSKYPIGLGTAELPRSVYKGKQPITSNEFKKYVNDYFLPKIKLLGFKGRNFNYYREQNDYIECVNFWTYQSGGAIQVDLLIKFKNVNYPTQKKEIKPSNINQENSEFIRRLSPFKVIENNTNIWFWIFNKDPEKNVELINDIWKLFQTCGMDFFKKFEQHEEYIEKITIENYQSFSDFYIQRVLEISGSGITRIGILYFLTDYWNKRNKNKAKGFAKKGIILAKEQNNVEYQTEFEKILTGI